MEFCPISRHYDVYIVMCSLESLRREDLYRIEQCRDPNSLGHMQHAPQQPQQQPHQPDSVRQLQCSCDLKQDNYISRSSHSQNTNDHHQLESDLSLNRPSGNAVKQSAHNHYPLMTGDEKRSGSQTLLIMYPTNIVSQRLLSGKPPLRPDRFPKISDDVEQIKKKARTKSEQTLSLPKNIKFENRYPKKFPNPLKQLYTFVKRISVSAGELSTPSTGNQSRPSITCSESIKLKQEPTIKQTQLTGSDIRTESTKPKRSTGRVQLPSLCQRSCATEGNAFQCCTCGRIIVLKRRSKEHVDPAQHKVRIDPKASKTDAKVTDLREPSTHYHNGGSNHLEVASSFTMTAYDVFSLACLLMVIPTLYTAYSSGFLDGVIDFQTEGLQKEFYCVVGLLVVARLSWHYARKFWNRYFAPLDETFFEEEVWAVITGCTNGIGKEYARQLAAKKLNVILISRDAGLLLELAREITNEYHVRTVTIQADFSSGDQSLYDMLDSRLQGFDIVILVNNVGTSHDTLDVFHVNTPDSLVTRLIHVNMMSMAKMSKMLLPGMLSRRRGVIINVSSAFGRNPAPYLAMYGATKSFADYFSRALQKEYGKHHIAVQSLTPYVVSTNMTMNAPTTMLLPSAETFVRSALDTVGLESRTHGYLPHSILGTILDNSPSLVRFYYMKLFRYQASKLMERQKLQQNN